MKNPDHRNFIFVFDRPLIIRCLTVLCIPFSQPWFIWNFQQKTLHSSPLPHHSDMQGVLRRGEGGWIEWLTPDLSSFAMLSFPLLYSYVLYYPYTCYIDVLCNKSGLTTLAFILYFHNFNHWRCFCVQYPWPLLLCHALVSTSLLLRAILSLYVLYWCSVQ